MNITLVTHWCPLIRHGLFGSCGCYGNCKSSILYKRNVQRYSYRLASMYITQCTGTERAMHLPQDLVRRGHTPWPPPHPSAPPPPHGSTSCPSLHTLVSAQAGCTPPSLHSNERKKERGRCEHVLHICTPPSNQQGSWWKTFAFFNYTYTFSLQLIIS